MPRAFLGVPSVTLMTSRVEPGRPFLLASAFASSPPFGVEPTAEGASMPENTRAELRRNLARLRLLREQMRE